jgi:hypothetical protein
VKNEVNNVIRLAAGFESASIAAFIRDTLTGVETTPLTGSTGLNLYEGMNSLAGADKSLLNTCRTSTTRAILSIEQYDMVFSPLS